MMASGEAAAKAHRDVLKLMQGQDWPRAEAACRALTARYPGFAAGWLAAGHIALARRRRLAALEAADVAARCAPRDPGVFDAVGTLRSFANAHERALEAYDQAVALAPREPRYLYNRASVRRFVGDLAGAEADYDRVIALNPRDYEAYFNRSELRVQTAERNHVAQLEALAGQPGADWRAEVQIRYALAKECEDLGDHRRAFFHLRRGADTRRAHMAYDVATDVATVDWIIEAYPRGPEAVAAIGGPHGAPSGGPSGAPIFIVGLPRSGTTLLERILGRHSALSSAGELDSFALALMDAARRRAGRPEVPRRELVALSAGLDFAALGQDYLRRAHEAVGAEGRFIDKMPLNYLYCGLIARALPGARIIHMTRHPMASGYAMYKTLFKDGYPFSYDLRDIARYYLAYRRLMDHWRATLPGAIHEIGYEDLVADQQGETRKVLAYLGLEWEDACADFHQNPTASTTASAAQVRRPLYDSSVAQWRHYAADLTTLSDAYASAGIL
jgi:tetratricopeptide (TPR) repeat protein